jgi:hypothetical protein
VLLLIVLVTIHAVGAALGATGKVCVFFTTGKLVRAG